jgi:hypothetical protein
MELKKQAAASQLSVPGSKAVRAKREHHDNVIEIGRRQAR